MRSLRFHLTNNVQAYGVLFWGWLGGHKLDGGAAKCGELLTIEKIGELLKSMDTAVTYMTTT